MCGIIGHYGIAHAAEKTREGLLVMASRGKEAAGLYAGTVVHVRKPADLPHSESTQALGHVLHAMVGCVPQPLQALGVLVFVHISTLWGRRS